MDLSKKLAVCRDSIGRYIYAIYSEKGFHEYGSFPSTRYGESEIRRRASVHGVELPPRFDWSQIPEGALIEKFPGKVASVAFANTV
jgi:hypothetical protein